MTSSITKTPICLRSSLRIEMFQHILDHHSVTIFVQMNSIIPQKMRFNVTVVDERITVRIAVLFQHSVQNVHGFLVVRTTQEGRDEYLFAREGFVLHAFCYYFHQLSKHRTDFLENDQICIKNVLILLFYSIKSSFLYGTKFY